EAEAGAEAEDRQPGEVRRDRGEQREAAVDGEVEQQHAAPPEVVGERAEDDRAEEHPGEAARDDERLAGSAELPGILQRGGEHAAEEDVVEIEEAREADGDSHPPVQPERRDAVEPRCDACRHVSPDTPWDETLHAPLHGKDEPWVMRSPTPPSAARTVRPTAT